GPAKPASPSKAPVMQSGLGAALAGAGAGPQDLGALSSGASDSFALATLDGNEDRPSPMASAAFAPADDQASQGDAFAPPQASADESLALAEVQTAAVRPSRPVELPATDLLPEPEATATTAGGLGLRMRKQLAHDR